VTTQAGTYGGQMTDTSEHGTRPKGTGSVIEPVVGRIAELWRYPVKSMQGEVLAAAELVEEHGIPGDRTWAVRDEVRGGVRGAKKIGDLMRLAARFIDEPTSATRSAPIEITLPDRSTVRSDSPDVAARISDAVNHPVTLWPLRPPTDTDHYRRGAPDHEDLLEELRDIFGREPGEPLPDLGVFPPEVIEFESPPGTYFDAYPLLLVSDRSLRSLAALAPDSTVDLRRFRPNLFVSVPDDVAPGDPWPEVAWVGRSLRLGSAVIDVVAPCPRCVMITRGFDDLPVDRALMRTVVREADQVIGVYATVRSAGRTQVGDELRMTD
jgi:uncharacterized protein